MHLAEQLQAALRRTFAGRPVISVGRDPRSAGADVGTLQALGAGPVLLLVHRPGPEASELLEEPLVHALEEGSPDPDFVLDMAALQARLGDLAPRDLAALVAVDPTFEAGVLAPTVLDFAALDGRPRLGGRRPEDARLEDKAHVDAVFDAAGLPRVAGRVVQATPESLAAAARDLDRGAGTVWQGDNTSACEGGALATRHVHDAATARAAAALLAPRCRRARVSPFLAGTPCSVHAVCLERGVAVGRPFEMAVLREPPTGRFVFAGLGTTWDAPPADRAELRDQARRLATWLHGARGYRGALSLDGVLTAEGFRPTEINARMAAGLSRLGAHTPDLPLRLLDLVVRQGALPEADPAELEDALLAAGDGCPLSWLHLATPRAPAVELQLPLTWTGGGWARGGDDASLTWRRGRVGAPTCWSPPSGSPGVAWPRPSATWWRPRWPADQRTRPVTG